MKINVERTAKTIASGANLTIFVAIAGSFVWFTHMPNAREGFDLWFAGSAVALVISLLQAAILKGIASAILSLDAIRTLLEKQKK